ncbi:MAG: alpha/beta hydrolase [Alphaproteobacteria bacterium]|nr:alpha/beta hydrolase [Alphaproteobacteria bacterium]
MLGRWLLKALLSSLTVALYLTSARAAPIDLSALDRFDCPDASSIKFLSGGTVAAHCGFLKIPESATGRGRTLSLAVGVILPDDAKQAALPPTIFLHGGPGGGILSSLWWIATQKLTFDRPMIVFDQRATGMSHPKLCEFLNVDNPTLDTMPPAASEKYTLDQLAECVTKLRADGVDLAGYDTDATVRDMETIRKTFKIETWNLYGVSYGTTVALAYLAAHSGQVRSAIMDSVYPPEMPGFVSGPADIAGSLQTLNTLCANQMGCRARFRDIHRSVEQAIATLEKQNLTVPPVGTISTRLPRHMNAEYFVPALRTLLMDPAEWPAIPLFIDDVRSRRATPLVSAAMANIIGDSRDFDVGVWLAIECRERAPFDDRKRVDETAAAWPALTRASTIAANLRFCDAWPSKRDRNWQTPRQSQIPTLVVAGAWDPTTPSAVSMGTADLPGAKSQKILVPFAGHGPSLDDTCLEQIVADFLTTPEKKIDQTCLGRRQPPVFITHKLDARTITGFNFWPLEFAGTIVWNVPFLVFVGLLSVAVWPLAWIMRILADYPLAKETPLWARSSLWLALATVSLVVWTDALSDALARHTNTTAIAIGNASATLVGPPTYIWAPLSAIFLIMAMTAFGGLTLAGEIVQRRRGPAPLAHRAWVLASLTAIIAALVEAELVPQTLARVLADAQTLLATAM